MTTENIVPFVFEDKDPLRVIIKDGEPWFVAADPCRILGLGEPSRAVERLDDDEKALGKLPNTLSTSQGNPTVWFISEGGLYTLIFRSQDAVTPGAPAHRFRRWVTGEVLPSIRKTGAYARSAPPLRHRNIGELMKLVDFARRRGGDAAEWEMYLELGLPVTPALHPKQGKLSLSSSGEGGK